MPTSAVILLGLIVTFLSLPVTLPFLSLIPKLQTVGRLPNTTSRHRLVSAIVLLVIAAYLLGFTFQSKPVNLVIVLLVAACFLNLIGLVFQIKPRYLALGLGIVIVLLFGLVSLGNLLSLTIDGNTSKFEVNSTLYCEIYQFGFAGNQGGLDVTLYRKVGLGLSHKVFHEGYLDEVKYPFSNLEGACKYAASKIND